MLKIFNKGLILPPPLSFYLEIEDLQQGFDDDGDGGGDGDDDDDDDGDDALPVVVEVPGKAQAFAVYIYIYTHIDAVEFGKKGRILIQYIYI